MRTTFINGRVITPETVFRGGVVAEGKQIVRGLRAMTMKKSAP